ncbi:MAG: ATP synthase F1 subunit delta [Prochlorotrichaceae cyanobacterium]|jgi:F-type H+-transporting ATPase subunit delta
MTSSFATAEIVEPYTEALKDLADSQGLLERVGEELAAVITALESSADLKGFLNSPTYSAPQKKEVVQRVFDRDVHPLVLNFLMLLIDRKRISLFPLIVEHYQKLLRAMKQIVLAEVTVAVPLTESQQREIVSQVRSMTNARDVELKVQQDPEILGGVIIQVGSQVFDASLRGQLRRIGVSLSR